MKQLTKTNRKTFNKRPQSLLETRRLLEHWPRASCVYVNFTLHVTSPHLYLLV